jgi:hypothetical protein
MEVLHCTLHILKIIVDGPSLYEGTLARGD